MVDHEPNPEIAKELGIKAKERILKSASHSVLDSSASAVVTWSMWGEGIIPETIINHKGIFAVTERDESQPEIPPTPRAIEEIPITHYPDFEPLIESLINRE